MALQNSRTIAYAQSEGARGVVVVVAVIAAVVLVVVVVVVVLGIRSSSGLFQLARSCHGTRLYAQMEIVVKFVRLYIESFGFNNAGLDSSA